MVRYKILGQRNVYAEPRLALATCHQIFEMREELFSLRGILSFIVPGF